MILTGCLGMERAYRCINWQSLILIAGMLPMGTAHGNQRTIVAGKFNELMDYCCKIPLYYRKDILQFKRLRSILNILGRCPKVEVAAG